MAYERHTWKCGETITAELLNNIEDGIEEALACCGGGDTYTVTFKAVEYGEVKDVLSPISVEKGKSIKLPNDYVGWYTHNEGESFDHCSQTAWTRVGNSGEDYTPTADVTLYAVEPCE